MVEFTRQTRCTLISIRIAKPNSKKSTQKTEKKCLKNCPTDPSFLVSKLKSTCSNTRLSAASWITQHFYRHKQVCFFLPTECQSSSCISTKERKVHSQESQHKLWLTIIINYCSPSWLQSAAQLHTLLETLDCGCNWRQATEGPSQNAIRRSFSPNWILLCVYVCVRERGRDRERESLRVLSYIKLRSKRREHSSGLLLQPDLAERLQLLKKNTHTHHHSFLACRSTWYSLVFIDLLLVINQTLTKHGSKITLLCDDTICQRWQSEQNVLSRHLMQIWGATYKNFLHPFLL